MIISMNRPDPLSWHLTPTDMLLRWPTNRPLASLWSGRPDRRSARWSIFAQPQAWLVGFHEGSQWIGQPPAHLADLPTVGDPLQVLRTALSSQGAAPLDPPRSDDPSSADIPPFQHGWMTCLSYELGREIEPASAASDPSLQRATSGNWPLYALAWCSGSIVFDHLHNRWWNHNTDPDLLQALQREPATDHSCTIGPVHASMGAEAYRDLVAQTIELIAAGDIFQANITQRLTATFAGSVRQLAALAMHHSRAWYGSHIELPGGRTIISMSPELFLALDGESREVITRPIKGTAASRSADTCPTSVSQRLQQSEKDAAELHMIIDLMRNDLGRVCKIGSIRVPAARIIEQHPTIQHGVGEVCGTLRDDCTIADLIDAAFPAGSITGAPKIRAMQIIEALEQAPRDAYCGSVGYVDAHTGNACLNVGIRTMQVQGQRPRDRADMLIDGLLQYGIGAGIVSDSQPRAEYDECMDKAAVFLRIAEACASEISSPLVSIEHAVVQQCSDKSDQPRTVDVPG